MSKVKDSISRARTLYRNHLWWGRLILAAVLLLLVLVVVRVSLPHTIIYSSVYWLGKQGINAQIEDISIDVDRGTFTILGASGIKNGERVFNIGKAAIDWEWRPLAAKTVHIKGIELEDFGLVAEQYTDAIVVAGVEIRQGEGIEQPPAEAEDKVAWGASLNRIDFRDLGFCFRQFDTPYGASTPGGNIIDYCGGLDLLTLEGDVSLGGDDTAGSGDAQTLSVDGRVKIEQLKLHNNKLEGALFSVAAISLPGITINGIDDVRLDRLGITGLALLQNAGHPRHAHAVEFSSLDVNGIALSNTDTLTIDTIAIEKPVMSMAMDESGAYRYEPWLLPQPPAPADQATEPQAAAPNPFNVRLGGITVTDSELCYRQAAARSGGKTPELDYCLSLAGTEWSGGIAVTTPSGNQPLQLALEGDLALTGLVATNNVLERDLVSFEKLSIDKLAVKGTDDLGFTALELRNLAGLELGTADNTHTLTVAGVDLATFSYRQNALSIDRAAVSDLGLAITLNEDGTLDYEQWLVDAAAPEDEQAAEDAASKGAGSEPLAVRIGEFKLDSTREIQFADRSVTPNMVVGLGELHVDVSKLDSSKPEQDSPLSLSAKTMRHGTVEIKGVARPFEAKPSFDATGKVTGIDLRVASPRVEQAVGHIIKSGQLDADLTLLSQQGVLDSKISLVLHQFNLKAKSKDDAAALDDKFGMPINQSLVLLKDKKGRIKLDIPITGDINDPSFDPTDAIIKATTKATAVTLVTFYTPYGLAFAGGNILLNLAKALNFDPLVFEPGSAALTDAHREQLSKLAEMLVERPAVYLTLCGYTNLDDRSKVTTEIIDKNKIKPPTAESLKKLKQLGNERTDKVKDHLVTVGKIGHDRLILCEPEHSDDAEAISGVEISI